MRWNLQNRIVIPSVIQIAVVTTAIGIGAIFACRSSLLDSLDDMMEDNCHAALSQMEIWVNEQQGQAKVLAADPRAAEVVAGTASEDEKTRLRESYSRVKAASYLETVMLAGPDGMVALSSSRETEGKISVGERAYFKTAMSGTFTISSVMMSKGTGRPIVVVAAPVMDANAKVCGVLSVVLDLGTVSEQIVKPLKILESGYVFMFDRDGQLLAHPDPALILKAKMQDFPWGMQILQNKNGKLSYSYKGVNKNVVYVTSDSLGWGVVASAPTSELFAPLVRLIWIVVGIGAFLMLVGGLIAFFTARSIARPLYVVVEQMNSHSEQTASAAGEVASASNSLAAGASEQASALEETSSSMEEVSSMARQNMDGAKQANEFARQARQSAEAGARDILEMGEAMNGIKASSDDIRKIVKTIDEIAFQTNILALNAAVEAARAGEAGAGFAVVADEVRTLAQRSAKAAKETALMIEDALRKSDQGVTISAKVSQELTEIVEKIRRVDELVASAAQASTEQSNGIAQVNTAITSMDKVTQSNAASAEECASASEELSAQAIHMKEAVADLLAIAEGTRDASESRPTFASARVSAPVPSAAARTADTGARKFLTSAHK